MKNITLFIYKHFNLIATVYIIPLIVAIVALGFSGDAWKSAFFSFYLVAGLTLLALYIKGDLEHLEIAGGGEKVVITGGAEGHKDSEDSGVLTVKDLKTVAFALAIIADVLVLVGACVFSITHVW